jgi:hypothetical protein
VALVIGQLEGLDHHDWFEQLHKRLFVSKDQLMAAALAVWLAVDDKGVEAERFITTLRAITEGVDPHPLHQPAATGSQD